MASSVSELLPRLADSYGKLAANLERGPLAMCTRLGSSGPYGDVRLIPEDGRPVAEVSLNGARLLARN